MKTEGEPHPLMVDYRLRVDAGKRIKMTSAEPDPMVPAVRIRKTGEDHNGTGGLSFGNPRCVMISGEKPMVCVGLSGHE